MKINPTLACADPLRLLEEIEILRRASIDIIHIDVMDGHYVPNLCFSYDTIHSIARKWPDMFLDIHLMVDDVAGAIERLSFMKNGSISFHPSTTRMPIRFLKECRNRGLQAGIVLNPSESVSSISELLPYTDMVTLMGVEPGFSGQQFLENTYNKVSELHDFLTHLGKHIIIQVDGGVDCPIAQKCGSLGVDMVVAGALAIYGQEKSVYDCCIDLMAKCSKKI